MFEENTERPIDRRRRPDKVLKVMWGLTLTSWGLILFGLLMTYHASPQQITILDIYRSKEIRNYWQPEYLFYALYLMIPGLFLSIVALALNSRRMKRKSDKFSIAIFLAITISIISMAALIALVLIGSF